VRRLRSPGLLALAAWAACVLAACSTRAGAGRGAEGGAAQPVRLWVAPVLWWGEGAAHGIDVALENATNRTVAIAAPDAAHARVEVFAGPESLRVCGVEPLHPADPAGPLVELAPGDRVAVRVSLADACGAVAPGAYRYEVSYRAPPPGAAAAPDADEGAGGRAFSGTLATSYGQIFVSGDSGPGRDGASAPAQEPTRESGAPLRVERRPTPGG
jgi:predicted small secreted protein